MAASTLLCKILSVIVVCFIFVGLLFAEVNNQFRSDSATEGQDSSFFFYRKLEYPRDCSEVHDSCSSSVSSGVYLIKPHGYTEPFEAYCDNEIDSGGWTTILRRLDGYVYFSRNWNEYKTGFGFLWTEYWIGNDKLAFLTNQAIYELRVDIILSNGTSCNVNYNAFRISDERSEFAISMVGTFNGDTACIWREGSQFTPMDERNPIDDSLNFIDCDDVYNAGHTQDGVYFIRPANWNGPSFQVFCNMSIDFGSWIVFQRRLNGSVDFYRNWAEYKEGFGDIQHEFWLGNEKLHHITQQGMYEYRLDYVYGSTSYYTKYRTFLIGNETNKYRVTEVGAGTGGTGTSLHNTENIAFSTYDQDNDGQIYNCAEGHHSGWWHGGYFLTYYYPGCFNFRHRDTYVRCSYANLNGDYNEYSDGKKIFDNVFQCAPNFLYTEMKIRRIFGI